MQNQNKKMDRVRIIDDVVVQAGITDKTQTVQVKITETAQEIQKIQEEEARTKEKIQIIRKELKNNQNIADGLEAFLIEKKTEIIAENQQIKIEQEKLEDINVDSAIVKESFEHLVNTHIEQMFNELKEIEDMQSVTDLFIEDHKKHFSEYVKQKKHELEQLETKVKTKQEENERNRLIYKENLLKCKKEAEAFDKKKYDLQQLQKQYELKVVFETQLDKDIENQKKNKEIYEKQLLDMKEAVKSEINLFDENNEKFNQETLHLKETLEEINEKIKIESDNVKTISNELIMQNQHKNKLSLQLQLLNEQNCTLKKQFYQNDKANISTGKRTKVELENLIKDTKEALEILKAENIELENEVTNLKVLNSDVIAVNEDLIKENENLTEQIDSEKMLMSNITSEIRNIENSNKEKSANYKKLVDEVKLKNQIEEAEFNMKQQQIESKVKELQNLKDMLEKDIEESNEKLKTCKRNKAELLTMNKQKESELDSLSIHCVDLVNKIRDLEKEKKSYLSAQKVPKQMKTFTMPLNATKEQPFQEHTANKPTKNVKDPLEFSDSGSELGFLIKPKQKTHKSPKKPRRNK